jgi:dsRNA-specific ribonuclease
LRYESTKKENHNNKTFTIAIMINDEKRGTGTDGNKKEAE